RLDVVVFRTLPEFQDFGGDLLGYVATKGGGQCVVMAPPDGAKFSNVLVHELTHVVLAQLFPTLPRWLNEGTAKSFETLELQNGGQSAVVGKTPWTRGQQGLDTRYLKTVDELFHWPANVRDDEEWGYYQSSWA